MKKRSEKAINREKRKIWKQQIYERDNFCCVFCNNGIKLEGRRKNAAHIIPEEFEETRHDIMNGLTACIMHHKWGKFSMHQNPLYVIEWLKEHRPQQYEYLVLKLAQLVQI